MRFFEVGGCVRDELMGVPREKIKDIDFAVEAESFEAMRDRLKLDGFDIFVETPEFLTIRARFPVGHEMFGRMTADFVLCRSDGPTKDNRRPEFVTPGTILDDLARRDFTMNAIAKDISTGCLIDPHGGMFDIRLQTIRFVGDPMERIEEDALRALRALRFHVTKQFSIDITARMAINSERTAELLSTLPIERVREELFKMFKHDTMRSMEVIEHNISSALKDAIFRNNELRLVPSLGG